MTRKPWYKRKRNRWIVVSVAVPLAIALIGGIFLVISAIFQDEDQTDMRATPAVEVAVRQEIGTEPPGRSREPHVGKSSLSFEEIEAGELQTTNVPRESETAGISSAGKELATYRFVMRNQGAKAVCVSGGEFLPSRVTFDNQETHYMMGIWEIDHQGHISVPVHEPKVGTPVPVPLDFAVPPGKLYEFTLWFRLDSTTQERRCGFYDIVGRLTLSCDAGKVVSEPFKMSLASIPNVGGRPLPRQND